MIWGEVTYQRGVKIPKSINFVTHLLKVVKQVENEIKSQKNYMEPYPRVPQAMSHLYYRESLWACDTESSPTYIGFWIFLKFIVPVSNQVYKLV